MLLTYSSASLSPTTGVLLLVLLEVWPHIISYIISHIISHILSHIISQIISHIISHIISYTISHHRCIVVGSPGSLALYSLLLWDWLHLSQEQQYITSFLK